MELFEKINKAFGGWYEGLFGGTDDVRPKDILRKILTALEEHRKEGFDNKVYVPNQYILEIAVDDEEEKEYLLSFLDREELETAIRRYCQQNHYHVRGALDFTIKEIESEAEGRRKDKVRVRCRYDSKLAAQKAGTLPADVAPALVASAPEDDATVSRVDYGDGDEGTVPAVSSAHLTVRTPGKAPDEVRLSRGKLTIGRSARAGNDLVLEGDGMVSRRHARIEMEADGNFTVYDLETTNGTRVNGKKTDNRALQDGDEIVIGETQITFHHPRDPASERAATPAFTTAPLPHTSPAQPRPARLVLTDGARDLDDYVLATVTVIGRGVTNDIVLDDRSVGTRHARIVRGEPYTLEVLDEEHISLLNGSTVRPGAPLPIRSGDRVGIGTQTLRFEEKTT